MEGQPCPADVQQGQKQVPFLIGFEITHNSDSANFEYSEGMNTLDPTPSEAQYQDKASKAAGLFLSWRKRNIIIRTKIKSKTNTAN